MWFLLHQRWRLGKQAAVEGRGCWCKLVLFSQFFFKDTFEIKDNKFPLLISVFPGRTFSTEWPSWHSRKTLFPMWRKSASAPEWVREQLGYRVAWPGHQKPRHVADLEAIPKLQHTTGCGMCQRSRCCCWGKKLLHNLESLPFDYCSARRQGRIIHSYEWLLILVYGNWSLCDV